MEYKITLGLAACPHCMIAYLPPNDSPPYTCRYCHEQITEILPHEHRWIEFGIIHGSGFWKCPECGDTRPLNGRQLPAQAHL